jgi:hypothetical protein
MKRLLLIVLLLIAPALQTARANSVDDASGKIAASLQKQYAGPGSQDIAIGDFVTVNIPRSTFGGYFTEALGEALKSKPSTTIIDQQKVDGVLRKREFSFNTEFDYKVLNDISYDIFQSAQETPTSYCFGQIKESGDDIKISVKMVDAITGATIAAASVTFPSDETTDRLLGRPIRVRKPLVPDTVVVVKERVVEKYIEKPVEKPAAPQANAGWIGFRIQGFVLSLKKCYFSGNDIVYEFAATNENDLTKTLAVDRAQVVDQEGNIVRCHQMSVGSQRESTYFRADLLSNVPVKVTFTFSGLSPKLTTMKALQITAQGQEFLLRDVPIEKE